MTTRRCTGCQQILPLDRFGIDRTLTTRCKRRYQCRDCMAAASKRYRCRRSDQLYRQQLDQLNQTRLAARDGQRQDRIEIAQLMVRQMRALGMSFAEIARRAGVDVKTPSRILSYGTEVKITRATVDRLMEAFVQSVGNGAETGVPVS